MTGILSYGAYVPRMRLSPATANWPHPRTRAAANFDEDAVTMAVAAAEDALAASGRADIDALYLGSTSLPYVEKQSAVLLAGACDLAPGLATFDVAHSLRAGAQALRLAADGASAGSVRRALVVASDSRLAEPGSDIERDGGDAAAAFVVGQGDTIAEVLAVHSVTNDILDVWRADGDRTLRATPEEHFRHAEGYIHAVRAAVEGLLARTGQKLAEFDRVAMYAPDPRREAEALRTLGVEARQRVDAPEGVGSAGSADALLRLVAALDEAAPGEQILLVAYGDGADAIALRTTDKLPAFRRGRRPLATQLARAIPVPNYYDYLQWRGLGPVKANGARLAPAPHALYREQHEVLRMRGMRCLACGMVQYPPQRICVRCQAKDQSEPVRMTEGGATLFSYSLDYVALTPDVPLLHGVVDFAVGGRAMMLVTDRDLDAVQIGMPLALTLRKFSVADGIHTYLWKAMPAP